MGEEGGLKQKEFGWKRKIIGGENLYGLISERAQPGQRKEARNSFPGHSGTSNTFEGNQ
jgi:hypothetical protein